MRTRPVRHRRPTLLAAVLALVVLCGCSVQVKPATQVSSSTATLNAVVQCSAQVKGMVWWQLRRADVSDWSVVGAQNVSCPSESRTITLSQPVSSLRSGASYYYRLVLDQAPNGGQVLLSGTASFSTAGGTRPVVVPASGSSPATLRAGSAAGPRLELRGANVWGLQDTITTSFGAAQYANRATVAATIRSWGANLVRFRVLADDYNSAPSGATGGLTRAQIIQRIKDWRDAVTSQGMYFMVCSWDALDGRYSKAGWAGNGHRVHQLFSDIRAALGDDPRVIYEVTNEPNAVSWDQWEANMRASIQHFRGAMGYKGLLVIDPIWWANSGTGGQGYSDARYSSLEAFDAAQAGMGGRHGLAFAKHDYASSYAGKAFNGSAWTAAQGGGQTKHLIFETEFGNYNGDPSTVSNSWSQAAASFFANRFDAQPNYVGAAAFVFGPWWDANAMTTADNRTPTTWGNAARMFLSSR